MYHSAHQTPGSAFFNPRLSLCPARFAHPPHLAAPHPPLATQGHASGLCMTARNIPCHKCFPKASISVTLSAAKTSPQPLMECASHFFECVNNFWLAGQTLRPGDVCSVCCVCRVCMHLFLRMYGCLCALCVCTCLCAFEYICVFVVFFSLFLHKAGKKGHVILPQLNQELHTGEGCCSTDLPDHVNEVPWLCSH